MNLAMAIEYLFPYADLTVDVIVQDDIDGNGPHVAHWDEKKLGPFPDKVALQAASNAAKAAAVVAARIDKQKSIAVLKAVKAEALSVAEVGGAGMIQTEIKKVN